MSSSMDHPTNEATDVVPLLLLIYGILAIAIVYGIVILVQQQRTKFVSSLADASKVRDTVNNKEIKTTYDNLISIYDKKILELNAQFSTGSVLNPIDIQYVVTQLQPHSSIWDVLCVSLTTPTTMEWSVTDYNRVHVVRQQRIEQQQQEEEEKANASSTETNSKVDVFDDIFNSDTGWDNGDDDGDDDDVNSKSNNKQHNDTQLQSKSPASGKTATPSTSTSTSTTGTTTTKKAVLLEGFDANVLGQQWVEKALQSVDAWPPKNLGILQHRTFEYIDPLVQNSNKTKKNSTNNKKNSNTTTTTTTTVPKTQFHVMDHPPLRRTLCMIIARFNAIMLNNHNELIDAGLKQLIDQTYFKSSMEFRNRMNMILETTVQMAILLQSYPLLCTILTAITTFKIGIQYDDDAKSIPYFNTIMTRQYNILPRLKINATTIRQSKSKTNDSNTNEGENDYDVLTTTSTMYLDDDTTTTSTAEIILDVERIHAQQFLKVKVQQYTQQNIPPEIGLQSYRERWWFMLRMKKKDLPKSKNNDTSTTTTPSDNNAIDQLLYQPITIPKEAKFTIEPKIIQLYENQKFEDRLLTAWPLTITNVAQQRGQVKIQFQIPKVVGQYTYYLHIHSSDFLGANQDLEFQMNVISRPNTTLLTTKMSTSNETDVVEAKKEK